MSIGPLPRIDVPEEGYYRTKIARGGPWVAARIYRSVALDQETGEPLDRSPVLIGEMYDAATGPRFVDPYELWPRVCGQSISEVEFSHMMRVKGWADKYDLSAPEAAPRKSIDLNRIKPIF